MNFPPGVKGLMGKDLEISGHVFSNQAASGYREQWAGTDG